jgi:hypothetical protein
MALAKAVAAGAIAALAVPYFLHENPAAMGGWLARGLVHFTLAGVHLTWSWPLFSIVTLFAWGLLAWANR